MNHLNYKYFLLLGLAVITSCVQEKYFNESHTQIYNNAINFHIPKIGNCQNYLYDFSIFQNKNIDYVNSTIAEYAPESCFQEINQAIAHRKDTLMKICYCIHPNFNPALIDEIIPESTKQMADIYLGSVIEEEAHIEVKRFDSYQSGLELRLDITKCKNDRIEIYNISPIYTNEERNRAVVYSIVESEHKKAYTYFLIRLGSIWFLEVVEEMDL